MSDVASYFPSYYDNILEIDILKNVENSELNTTYEIFQEVYRNQFIVTCDENGIVKYETLLGIIANPSTETLQFRIERVLNRLNQKPPYTINFLKLFLDDLLGKNKYNIYVNDYTLYFESSLIDQQWFEEISITINNIKPCNIQFINKPVIRDFININEEILKSQTLYARLGSLRLGHTPFVYKEESQMIKTGSNKSIQNNLINFLSEQTKNKISYAMINNTTKITDFVTKDIEDNVVTLEYNVTQSMNINQINNIKLYDVDDNLLASSDLYVPVSEDALITHKIKIQEGV